MSSIENGDEASAFFARKLVPLAEEYRRRKVELVPVRPDPAAESYFFDRERISMSRADFEFAGTASLEDFRIALARHWRAAGHPELAALADDFVALAAALYKADQLSEELSPFIYVMF